MARRAWVLVSVIGLVMAVLIAGPLGGSALQGDKATPEASPAGSPAASPAASPVAITGDVEAGKKVAAQCLACHSTDGSQMVGPTWLGLYGHEVELEDGSTVIADDAYLMESILDPNAKVVKGFPAGAMPPYGSILTDDDVANLIAFIRSLSETDES
ncbi:MAG: c-type cytochrome [Thermomicrobiales bacterium]